MISDGGDESEREGVASGGGTHVANVGLYCGCGGFDNAARAGTDMGVHGEAQGPRGNGPRFSGGIEHLGAHYDWYNY